MAGPRVVSTSPDPNAPFRRAVRDAFETTKWLPVAPLIDLILQYASSFYCYVSTVGIPDAAAVASTAAASAAPAKPTAHQFASPVALLYSSHDPTARADAPSRPCLLVVDSFAQCIFQLFESGEVKTFAGSVYRFGYQCGAALSVAQFGTPGGIVADPLQPNRFYVCDGATVCVVDYSQRNAANGEANVLLLAGGGGGIGRLGSSDGVGPAASFNTLNDIVCTRDGKTLIVADLQNRKLRVIDTASSAVTTLQPQHHSNPKAAPFVYTPCRLAFDRTSEGGDSVLYVTSRQLIVRVDRHTGVICAFDIGVTRTAVGIASLPNGRILFSCDTTHSLYSFDPASLPPPPATGNGITAVNPTLLAGPGRVVMPKPSRRYPRDNGGGGGYVDGWVLPDDDGSVPRDDGFGGGATGGARFWMPGGLCVVDGDRTVLVAGSHGFVRRATLPPEWFDPTPLPPIETTVTTAATATATATTAAATAKATAVKAKPFAASRPFPALP